MSDNEKESKIQLYLRASTPLKKQPDEVIGFLEFLENQGHIDSFDVHEVPKQAHTNNETSNAINIYEKFEEWANKNEVSIQPFFKKTEYQSSLSGDEGEIVKFPVMSLSIHKDGELNAIYPCLNNEGTHTVYEFLSGLNTN